MGTFVTELEIHCTLQIAATISSTIEIFRVLQESLSLGVVLALDRQPRQHIASITLHQLKEIGPTDAAFDRLATPQTAFATEHDRATQCMGQNDIDAFRFLHEAYRAFVVVAYEGKYNNISLLALKVVDC